MLPVLTDATQNKAHLPSSGLPSSTGVMAFLGSAVRRVVATAALRPSLSPLWRTTARTYSSEPTQEKGVPYKMTLKQNGASSGPTKPLPR